MKKPIPVLTRLLVCFICFPLFLPAQEAITTTGDEAVGSGGTVSYSVGQVAYITNSSADYSEAQGVQQPFEISVLTNLVELNGQSFEAQLFPNPTIDQLTLSIKDFPVDDMTYLLYDLQGRQLAREPLQTEQTEILVSHLPAATYFLHIVQDQQVVTIFKFLKN